MRESLRDIDRLNHIKERIGYVMSFVDIVDMRNVLVHGYSTTSPLFIWETYTKDLPALAKELQAHTKGCGGSRQRM